MRLQGLLRPVRTENAGSPSDAADIALETAENGGMSPATQNQTGMEPFASVERVFVGQATPPQH